RSRSVNAASKVRAIPRARTFATTAMTPITTSPAATRPRHGNVTVARVPNHAPIATRTSGTAAYRYRDHMITPRPSEPRETPIATYSRNSAASTPVAGGAPAGPRADHPTA